MISLIVRVVLALGGSLAAFFVARDSPNFGVVQGMVAVAILAAAVIVAAFIRRK